MRFSSSSRVTIGASLVRAPLVLYFSLVETTDRGFFFCVPFLLYCLEYLTLPLADNADVFGTKSPEASPKFARRVYLRDTRHGSPCFVER